VSAGLWALVLLLAATEPTAVDSEQDDRWVPVGVPIVSYNADEGFGFGTTAGFHHYSEGVRPFRDDLAISLFVTTRLIQRYELRWEGLQVLDLPLRMRVVGGLFSTAARNFCGFGNGVRCSAAVAQERAEERGLSPGSEAYEEFVRRYYLVRFVRPFVDVTARWRLYNGDGFVVDALGGWRLAWHLPGDFNEPTPYPGSLYAEVFPEGERGISSVPELGLVIDGRDFEPLPVRGFYAEVAARVASPLVGSQFQYAGLTAWVAGWHPVGLSTRKLVVGARLLVDLMVGEPPLDELADIGGTTDQPAFGGMWIGRGIRSHRFVGKLKVIEQTELRGFLLDFEVWRTPFDVYWVGFFDLGWVGADWDDIRGRIPGRAASAGNPLRVLASGGGGLRILVRDTFVVRLEVGLSHFEQVDPNFYTPVGAPF
jgi:hypothetical protein